MADRLSEIAFQEDGAAKRLLVDALANSRTELDKIGDGDWTPQDGAHVRLIIAAKNYIAAVEHD